jgi:hypothetical protein
MFLAKTPFCSFDAGNNGNKFGKKYHKSFYGKEAI